ncbi:MAG TPA: N-acetylglucosamine-6-phosphate deacetylase [Candidatus Limnocylindrales bacterium]|nr:N-acetylglucosamine-6-phosphate deacetylase [Candidatus Limnocylindrales bacterium]
MATTIVEGRLVLDEVVSPGRLVIEDGRIAAIEPGTAEAAGPYIAPGFVDVHVHGWGGHDAMADVAALDGMARALLRRGVTAFLPTAVTAALDTLRAFADLVRAWQRHPPADGAEPLGFNLEGPFISPDRRGAQNPAFIIAPAPIDRADLEPLLPGLRITTIAPEVDGGLELIRWLAGQGVAVSLGHSVATVDQGRAGYAAGARTTTHLFNAMTGVDHRQPGLAVAALLDDSVAVELIADGNHVARALWPLIARAKPADRLLLVSDALALAGMGDGITSIGGLAVEVSGTRAMLLGTTTLAGSVIALDTAVRNLVAEGVNLPAAVAAASRNPLDLIGVTDRGRLAVGQRADLVELDDQLVVRRVARAGAWFEVASGGLAVAPR